MGSYGPPGSRFFNGSGNTAQYPLDGSVGTATTTIGSSETVSAVHCTIYGLLVTVTAAVSLLVKNHAGTTLLTIPLATTTVVPQYIPLGGPTGMFCLGGVSIICGTGVSATMFYDRVQ